MKQEKQLEKPAKMDEFITALLAVDFNNRTAEFQYK